MDGLETLADDDLALLFAAVGFAALQCADPENTGNLTALLMRLTRAKSIVLTHPRAAPGPT